MPVKMSLFALLFMNQRGSIGFGLEKFYRRMEEDKGGAGGGGTETEAEKKARLDKEAADKAALEAEDFDKLPAWAQKQIKDLRKESSGNRIANKTLTERMEKIEKGLKVIAGGEDDSLTPEQKLEKLTQSNEAATVENTILALAVDNGITKEEMKYFKFLINEKLDALGENEELTEDAVTEIAVEAKGKKAPEKKGPANSSVNNGQGGKGKAPTTEVTAEQFKKMGVTDKTKLYRENPELYNKLFNEVGL